MDFSNYNLSKCYYGGTERKLAIEISGQGYMLKFQKYSEFGPSFNHVSEYLGSHIFELLGFKVQETMLGQYNGENVVACKNFVPSGAQFVPFNDVGESTLEQDKDTYRYTYEDITRMLEDNRKMTNVEETIEVFWQMFIVDALLGNFDRHGGNWGFIKQDDQYTLAPVFDNGACLFPKLSDDTTLSSIINSEKETNERVYNFPTSQIKIGHSKSSYYDVISCMRFDECNKALIEVYNRIDLKIINNLVESCEISSIRKQFYCHMIDARYHKILEESYNKLK